MGEDWTKKIERETYSLRKDNIKTQEQYRQVADALILLGYSGMMTPTEFKNVKRKLEQKKLINNW